MATLTTRSPHDNDRPWVSALVGATFGSSRVVSRETDTLPGLVAECDSKPVGLLQFRLDGHQCEVVILIAVHQRQGVGQTLMQALRSIAEAAHCDRIWLVTTNNNQTAQAFYKAVGFRAVAIYPGAIATYRKLKPELPEVDETGTAIADEIEFELTLLPS